MQWLARRSHKPLMWVRFPPVPFMQKEREDKRMDNYLIFLLGFSVQLRDRRDGEEKTDFVVLAYPGEHPDDLRDATVEAAARYNALGYDVMGIKHQESKVVEMDIKKEYQSARTTEEYWNE